MSQLAKAARAAVQFNKQHPVGTRVRYWKGPRQDHPPCGETTTASEASVLGGHTAVIWLDGVSGCIALTHVEPCRDGQGEGR